MSKIKLMVNGLPGKMASATAITALRDHRVELIPLSLTGEETKITEIELGGVTVKLVKPEERDQEIKKIHHFITIDYTHPSALLDNAIFYCKYFLPFVMGTTGGNLNKLGKIIAISKISAVVAPNMAKQIVGFNAMMEYCANTFPGIFSGYLLTAVESHQSWKADTSGTAKATLSHLKKMGVKCDDNGIKKVRDPDVQRTKLKVAEEYINGHAWHSYHLVSEDKTVLFEFKHNVNGRNIYAEGTIDAACFLKKKLALGHTGQIFSMVDVLKDAGVLPCRT